MELLGRLGKTRMIARKRKKGYQPIEADSTVSVQLAAREFISRAHGIAQSTK
jgi:hypothetical protein